MEDKRLTEEQEAELIIERLSKTPHELLIIRLKRDFDELLEKIVPGYTNHNDTRI
mgnify:CR=1 FL=1